MAAIIVHNKYGGKAVMKFVAVDGAQTVPLANLSANSSETVVSSGITSVYWTGPWTLARGSNTVLSLTDGQDNWIFDGDFALRQDGTGSFVATPGSSNGTLIVEVNKITSDEHA